MITYTVQPSAPHDSAYSHEPGWYTMCITNPTVKRKIPNTPGYSRPLDPSPSLPERAAKSHRPPPGSSGLLFLNERAILMTFPTMRSLEDLPSHSTEAEIRQAGIYEEEKTLKRGSSTLP
ncbi:hypothetical protein V5O48_014500 [Marasmius crinis-equi]|uniref:Uncharacterized protein n=1 Tax=Marasmius crinis-equi TaxID=585013 RepID=A0ABR3EX44_9AGAR